LTISRSLRLSLIARTGASLRASRVVPDPGKPVAPDPGAAAVPTAQGPTDAVDELVAVHADAVYRYALRLTRSRHEAEDLAQETLLKGWRHRRRLRDPRAGRVWLLTIATNLHRDHVRSFRPMTTLAADPPLPLTACPSDKRLEHRECVARALEALDELPERQRQVLHLITVEQLSGDEAAAILDISPGALKASLSLARQTMRERLKDVYEDLRGARRDR
jgi:RNA polymerase sigma-70 factor, ECF subfamily